MLLAFCVCMSPRSSADIEDEKGLRVIQAVCSCLLRCWRTSTDLATSICESCLTCDLFSLCQKTTSFSVRALYTYLHVLFILRSSLSRAEPQPVSKTKKRSSSFAGRSTSSSSSSSRLKSDPFGRTLTGVAVAFPLWLVCVSSFYCF